MDNVRCTGTELSLIDCPHSRSHSCSHRDDAAVQCQTSKVNQQRSILIYKQFEYILYAGITCYDGDVRLENGSSNHLIVWDTLELVI